MARHIPTIGINKYQQKTGAYEKIYILPITHTNTECFSLKEGHILILIAPILRVLGNW